MRDLSQAVQMLRLSLLRGRCPPRPRRGKDRRGHIASRNEAETVHIIPALSGRCVNRVFILQPIFSLDLNTRLHFLQIFSPVLQGCVTNKILFQPL